MGLQNQEIAVPFPTMKRGSGEPLGTYRIGPYVAMLIGDAEGIGPIKYFFMLIVTQDGGTSPELVVTLEHNEMQAELLRSATKDLDEEGRKEFLEHAPKSFLCAFDKNGDHHICDKYSEVLSQDQFREEAFSVIARRLRIKDTPSRIDEETSSPSVFSSISPKWPLVLTLIVLALVFVFPPYTDHFISPRTGEISGHGGWKLIFEIGKNNTRFRTESINIGLFLFEILLVLAAGSGLWFLVRKR